MGKERWLRVESMACKSCWPSLVLQERRAVLAAATTLVRSGAGGAALMRERKPDRTCLRHEALYCHVWR